MFAQIMDKIAANSKSHKALQADFDNFKAGMSSAMGDAAPDKDHRDLDGFTAGIASLHARATQSDAHKDRADQAELQLMEIAEALGIDTSNDEGASDGASDGDDGMESPDEGA